MKVIGINGSPRKDWNTGTLLAKALDGAASQGAQTERIDLYDLQYTGCISCFACKHVGGQRVCAVRDDIAPVLESLRTADAVLFGSPIYFSGITAGLIAFLERFLFPNIIYSAEIPTVFPKILPSAFLYTMNITQEQLEPMRGRINRFERVVERVLRQAPELLYACNTYQYSDYDQYEHSIFSMESKEKQRAEQFPIDCEQAFALGAKLAQA